LVHANDFANSYFKNIESRYKLSGEQIHEIGEIRAMAYSNVVRRELKGAKMDVRTEYQGEKLLKHDGITPLKDYGFNVLEGLNLKSGDSSKNVSPNKDTNSKKK
jgi:hypothetical protein